ncbi:LOW QUALITY PROTEIN: pentatricopeptide repeat-containing protein At3g26540 [Camellia sinensis]|uniref:LOW QUALITY PROTEIN: pentatricopeptide repeat-containing protein At3g26540 n=1 Tax=Camellia sinensis TaxID=4442 RepID=UPI001036157E|nr:LOW QUALITY PROTEIN: pentatricopeptide repeat-containing protein At3g26540 [Camellia sinensis]
MGVNVNAASVLNRLLHNNTPKPSKTLLPTNAKSLTNSIVADLNSGHLRKAVSVLFNSPIPFPFSLYARLFQLCSSKHAIVEARKVESHLVSFSPTPPIFLLNRAIETYGKCGCLEDARELFDEMPQRDGGSWNAIITAYAQGGCAEKALCLFLCMNRLGVSGNEITFASALGSCGAVLALVLSRQIHGLIVKCGLSGNVILESSLVDVYGKCRVMSDARRMFYEIQKPNAVSWNVIVRRYLDMGQEREAVFMFFEMVRVNVKPLCFTVSNSLVACSRISAVKEGIQIHGLIIKTNIEEYEVVLSSLMDMYVKCRDLENARRIFDMPRSKNLINWTAMVSGYAIDGRTREARELFNEMPERNVISWNAMLVGYIRFFQWEEALDFVFLMRKQSKDIDYVTLGLILNVCTGLWDVELGKQVHGFSYRHGFYSNLFVGNALLDMYGKCGNLISARVWFYQMSHWRDRVSWNALLTSHARHGLSEEAMTIFWEMQGETTPSKYTFGTLLAACANIFALEPGRQIHGFMMRNGYEIDVVIRGALVDMYSKCRCLEYAIKVFKEATSRDLILWNSMVLGCCHNKRGEDVLELFGLMEKEGVKPDHITLQGILLACICEGRVELGRQYFNSMSTKFCIIPRLEHYECMIELFGRYGFMDELEDFVKTMPFEPTVQMLTKVFDACREHRHLKLGEWAANRLNEMNPSVPFQIEFLDKGRLET